MLYFVQVALVMVSLLSSGTVIEIGKRGSTKGSDLTSEIKFVFSRGLVYSESERHTSVGEMESKWEGPLQNGGINLLEQWYLRVFISDTIF